MAWLAVGELRSRGVALLATPVSAWRVAGFATFLGGVILGSKLQGAAIGLTLGCFIGFSPLLVVAGLLYEFQTETERRLPGFKTLLVLMLLCWTVLAVFALGTLALGWNAVARFLLLLMMAAAIAGLIFYRVAAPPKVTSG